jgi:hypothetical protein
MTIAHNILLLAAQKPLHVTEIIDRAQGQFHVTLDRESLMSALTS